MKELEAAGRAIALADLRMVWLAALRADLRRAVRNILAVGGWRMAVVKRRSILVMSWLKLFRFGFQK
jgi:hypothetical protein